MLSPKEGVSFTASGFSVGADVADVPEALASLFLTLPNMGVVNKMRNIKPTHSTIVTAEVATSAPSE